jgi:hypothetical protein
LAQKLKNYWFPAALSLSAWFLTIEPLKSTCMMRNALVQLGLVLLGVTSVHAVKLLQTASLRAHISPAEGAEQVWAIQGADSIRLSGSNGQYFVNEIPTGNWLIRVDTKSPYRTMNVEVADIRPGIEKDLGEIKLIRSEK